ncbi:MAG TPA: HAD-IIA family hydrolase [Clostridiales bacterium]|nr:HAD-IIA family hydrolase [Clostridiales bacterium]
MNGFRDLIYLIDMDGTIYRGSAPIPCAKEFIEYLKQAGRKFLLVTNCPGSSTESLIKKLSGMGIELDKGSILSSGDAAAEYLIKSTSYRKIYCIGSKALQDKLAERGLELVSEKPDCVVVGYDREFDYEKMKNAVQFILDGAAFVCTNYDATIPEGEKVVPHTGAIAEGIKAATGVEPVIIGKPESHLLSTVVSRFGCSREQCCIVGDRLDTDVYFGVKQNIKSFLVLTGVTTRDMLKESSIQPTKVFNNLYELMQFDEKVNSNQAG